MSWERSQATSSLTRHQTVTCPARASRTRSLSTAPPPSEITPPVGQRGGDDPPPRGGGTRPRPRARRTTRSARRARPRSARRRPVASVPSASAAAWAALDLPAAMNPMKTIAGPPPLPTCATRSAPCRRRSPRARRRCGRRRTSRGRRPARVRATIASPTTPAAGTTVESVRSRIAWAGSLVSVSTERSGLVRVEIGLIAARTISGSPLVMPPSRPPARLVSRCQPSSSLKKISSWASEPGPPATSQASPRETPLTDWIETTAWARRPSSFSRQETCEPSPGTRPKARTSKVPPSALVLLAQAVDLLDHRRGGLLVEAADRGVVHGREVIGREVAGCRAPRPRRSGSRGCER